MAVERIPPHLTVGDDLDSGPLLQCDGLVHGTIFHLFECLVRKAACFILRPCLFQVLRAQETPNHVATIHCRFLSFAFELKTDQTDVTDLNG